MPATSRRPRLAPTSRKTNWYRQPPRSIAWGPYVFVRLVLYLVAGIAWVLAGLPFHVEVARWCLSGLVACYLLIWGIQRSTGTGRRLATPFGLLAFGIVCQAGALLTYEH